MTNRDAGKQRRRYVWLGDVVLWLVVFSLSFAARMFLDSGFARDLWPGLLR